MIPTSIVNLHCENCNNSYFEQEVHVTIITDALKEAQGGASPRHPTLPPANQIAAFADKNADQPITKPERNKPFWDVRT